MSIFENSFSSETWRDIKGFEGVYAISTKGRIASKKRGEWHILSNVNSKGGYLSVVLVSRQNKRSTRIHRLVYETFIGDIPEGRKNHIHHINGNKQYNRVENLTLNTAKEHNLIHSKENPHKNDGMIHYNKYVKTRKINQYDLNGNYITTFNNGAEASIATGVCQRNILQVANKEPYNKKGLTRKQAGGFIWEFVD